MDEIEGIRFRPSLVIFVGDEGKNIYDQFNGSTLLPALDVRLYQAVGLMYVPGNGNIAEPEKAIPLPIRGEIPSRMPQNEDTLENLLRDILTEVQSERNNLSYGDGRVYDVPETRTQMYIVGDVNVALMGTVLQEVNKRLEIENFDTLVCYILSGYRANLNARTNAPTAPMDWASRDKPSFSYLYEHKVTFPVKTFLNKDDAHYAAAEALFSLISTGVTASDIYQQIQRIEPRVNLDDPADVVDMSRKKKKLSYNEYSSHVGGMSTSLIIFPREAVTNYCSALLGADVMEEWHQEVIHGRLKDGERDGVQRRARVDAANIEGWMEDSTRRPGMREDVTDYKGPNLDVLKTPGRTPHNGNAAFIAFVDHIQDTNKARHRALWERTQELFGLFTDQSVQREYKKRRRKRFNTSSDEWIKASKRQAGKASDILRNWDGAATQAWTSVGQWLCSELKHKIDHYLRNENYDNQGHKFAQTYIDAFDDSLAHTRDRLAAWRASHEQEYTDALSRFEEIAKGPWNTGNRANITGATALQARPTLGHQVGPDTIVNVVSPVGGGGSTPGGVGGSPGGRAAHKHLTERELQIELSLQQRISWKQQQVPSPATQFAAGTSFLGILALLIQTLSPLQALDTKLSITSTVLAACTLGVVNIAFYQRRVQEANAAKRDLLQFYCLCYAHKCEQREDELRVIALGPLRRKVQRMRERLDNMMFFVATIRDALCRQAGQEHDELFDGPAGIRDIFVANGERLQRQSEHISGAMLQNQRERRGIGATQQRGQREHTLVSFKRDIDQVRIAKASGETDWHRTDATLKRMLIESFNEEQESIIELSDAAVQRRIYEFMLPIIREYLQGSLVAIQNALDKDDVWRAVIERVKKPLYDSPQGPRDAAQFFICGRKGDVQKGKNFYPSRNSVKVYTDNKDWLLVASLFQGGLLSSLRHDLLFPLNPTLMPEDDDDELLEAMEDADLAMAAQADGVDGTGAHADHAHVGVSDSQRHGTPSDQQHMTVGAQADGVDGAGAQADQPAFAVNDPQGHGMSPNQLDRRMDALLDGEPMDLPEDIDVRSSFDKDAQGADELPGVQDNDRRRPLPVADPIQPNNAINNGNSDLPNDQLANEEGARKTPVGNNGSPLVVRSFVQTGEVKVDIPDDEEATKPRRIRPES